MQVLFDRLKNGVRIQLDVAHDLGEHVPFDLRKREKDVFVGQQRVLAAPSLLDRAVDDALRGFTNLAGRDVEIFYVHGRSSVLSARARRTPVLSADEQAVTELQAQVG